MEQREHPRIQIPLVVELSHPSLGKQRTTARDISEGGVFVQLPDPQIRVGAKLKVQLLNLVDIDNQPTPTVDMEVKRATEQGLGLAFLNKTGEHLWSTAARMRGELEIGRDYFQVYQSLVVFNEARGVLLVQQNGKWLLPGHYLQVGDQSVTAMRRFALDKLGVELSRRPRPIATDSEPDISVPQAATMNLIYVSETDTAEVNLADDAPYKEVRWMARVKDIKESTFVSEFQRSVASEAIEERQKPTE